MTYARKMSLYTRDRRLYHLCRVSDLHPEYITSNPILRNHAPHNLVLLDEDSSQIIDFAVLPSILTSTVAAEIDGELVFGSYDEIDD